MNRRYLRSLTGHAVTASHGVTTCRPLEEVDMPDTSINEIGLVSHWRETPDDHQAAAGWGDL